MTVMGMKINAPASDTIDESGLVYVFILLTSHLFSSLCSLVSIYLFYYIISRFVFLS